MIKAPRPLFVLHLLIISSGAAMSGPCLSADVVKVSQQWVNQATASQRHQAWLRDDDSLTTASLPKQIKTVWFSMPCHSSYPCATRAGRIMGAGKLVPLPARVHVKTVKGTARGLRPSDVAVPKTHGELYGSRLRLWAEQRGF